jgi:hypothetical protein
MNAPIANWLELLRNAAATHPKGNQGVADDLEVSRTTISLVLGGKYPAKTDKIAAKVIDLYARLTCPHTGVEISHAECRSLSIRVVPTSSPQAMRHWRACQGCIHKGGK